MKKKILVFMIILVSLILITTVFAEKGGNSRNNANSGGSSGGSSDSAASSGGNGNSGNSGSSGGNSVASNSNSDGKGEKERIRVESQNGKNTISSGDSEVSSDVELEEIEENGRIRVNARLSNGNNQEMKVMPDKASEAAALILSENMEITLKEVSKGKDLGVVYNANSAEDVKIFGFNKKMKISVEIDAQTGNITKIKRPWWAFLAKDDKKVTICHIPPGDSDNKHTITIGRPALNAHLNHGDYVGDCSGDIDDNQKIENLTLEILSPMNTTYLTNFILVNISSNGNVVYSINNGSNEIYNESIFREFVNGSNELSATVSRVNKNLTESISAVVIFNINPVNITVPENQTGTNQTNSTV